MVARIGAAGADVPAIESVTQSTQQLATSMGEDVRTLITQMEAANAARDQRMMSMIQMMMQSMTSPRRIVRGPDGRAMGVEMGTMQ
jgi:hypothetical protein